MTMKWRTSWVVIPMSAGLLLVAVGCVPSLCPLDTNNDGQVSQAELEAPWSPELEAQIMADPLGFIFACGEVLGPPL